MTKPPYFPPCDISWHDFTRMWLHETAPGERFPTRNELWWGMVLGTIAQIAAARDYPQAWQRRNCLLDNLSGDEGVVTFAGEDVIGVFFAHEDQRSPWPGRQRFELEPYFAGMPPSLVALARSETLCAFALHESWYPLPFEFVPGRFGGPLEAGGREDWATVITSAFWGTGDILTAVEPWGEVFEHGAWQLRRQLMAPDRALAAWQGDLDLSDAAIAHVRDIYERRRSCEAERMPLGHAEWVALEHHAHAEHWEWLRSVDSLPRAERAEEVERERQAWAEEMFAAIGIDLM